MAKRNQTWENVGNVIGKKNSNVNSIDPAELLQTSIHCFPPVVTKVSVAVSQIEYNAADMHYNS